MKKNILSFVFITSALIACIFTAPSCNKGTTNSTQTTQQLVSGNLSLDVPIFPKNGEYDSMTAFNFKINMDSFVKSFDHKYDTSSIRSVKLRSCMLTITNMDVNNNFRNFHTANIGVASSTNKYFYRIATHTDIVDTAAYFLDIPTLNDPNLADYFKGDSICYRLYGNLRTALTVPLKCKATLTYDMVLAK